MSPAEPSFPIALYRRRRRFAWGLAALVGLLLAAVVPILGIAQASRQEPVRRGIAAPYPAPAAEIDRPATITLGALIEVQRRERAQRRALAEMAEQAVTALPPGEVWQAQLGAFSSLEAAERQRARLIDAGVPAVIERAGALHRLHSRPAPRDETEGLCARAQAQGVDCFMRQVI